MFSQTWQVGLDIQKNSLRALAAQRRRQGWQLRHWWQHTLTQSVLRDGHLENSAALIPPLQQLRKRLPQHISLRIALPAQRVLQQTMPIPDSRLQESIRNQYITTKGLKQFPLDSQTLVLDYSQVTTPADCLLLTAARQVELKQWLNCLQQADLSPQVVDITPCALSSMAEAARLPTTAGLLHRLESEWLWVGPRTTSFSYGVLSLEQYPDAPAALTAMYNSCPQAKEHKVYYSTLLDETVPSIALAWTPFAAFTQLQAPLPKLPAAFVLAAGLALRRRDS